MPPPPAAPYKRGYPPPPPPPRPPRYPRAPASARSTAYCTSKRSSRGSYATSTPPPQARNWPTVHFISVPLLISFISYHH